AVALLGVPDVVHERRVVRSPRVGDRAMIVSGHGRLLRHGRRSLGITPRREVKNERGRVPPPIPPAVEHTLAMKTTRVETLVVNLPMVMQGATPHLLDRAVRRSCV